MKNSNGFTLHPSPALVIRADTAIKAVIDSMQANRVGSILVVSDRGDGELVGIFTERDLLMKVHLVLDSKSWTRPIRTVMESPVITLDIEDFDEASEIMIQRGIRHLPVTYKDSKGKTRIAGVLSMRDLFRAQSLGRQSKKKGQAKPIQIGMATEDGGLFRYLDRSLKSILDTEVERLGFRKKLPEGQALRDLERLGLLVFDLDDYEPKAWADFMRLVLRTKIPKVFLVFDPSIRSQQELEILEKLENSSRIVAFSKPLNVFSMMDRLLHAPENSPS